MKEEERGREGARAREAVRARALYAIVHVLCREQRAGWVDCLGLCFAFVFLFCREDHKFCR